jgi:Tfp pilus assembly protein PilN
MRAINLIPKDQRRGQHAPTRTGPIVPYLVVGLMVAALAGVSAVVLVGNQIADREAEVVELKREESALRVQAERLASYVEFRTVREQRAVTVAGLADSRFDWERVLRELALVLPEDVWLVKATGTASPGVTPTDGANVGTRGSVMGPALELKGCAPGQDAVAGFVAALEDIDGVTRVGVATSKLPDLAALNSEDSGGGGGGATGQEGDDCRTRDFLALFEIVVAFDAVPVPGTVPATAPDGTTPVSQASPELGEVQAEQQAAKQSAATQTDKARNAVQTLMP